MGRTHRCAAVLIVVVTIVMMVKNAPFLEINHDNSTMKIGSRPFPLYAAESLQIQSDLVAEYTSAFKETSQEFRTNINVQLKDQEMILLFEFKTDYQEPSAPINALYQFLKSSLKQETISTPRYNL